MSMNGRVSPTLLGLALTLLVGGCGPQFGPQARNGMTFYCPGAGNIDFGDQGVRQGLQRARPSTRLCA